MKAFIAIVLTVISLSHSKPSQAGVGAIMLNPPVIYTGLAMAGGGTLLFFYGAEKPSCDWCFNGAFEVITGMLIGTVGLLVLDSEEGQLVTFSKLDKKAAQKLDISESERLAFNAELDQANLLVLEVNDELSKKEDQTLEKSTAAWESVKGLVSAETFSAMQKIAAQSL